MVDDDRALDRRSFLVKVVATSTATLLPAIAAPTPTPATLDPNRVPVWHPACSGFNHPSGLVVRRDLDSTTAVETVLDGLDARLWCLCGGRYSETDLVRVLISDDGVPKSDAEVAVASFLRSLYRHQFLVPSDTRGRAAFTSHEREAPPAPGGPTCRPSTA